MDNLDDLLGPQSLEDEIEKNPSVSDTFEDLMQFAMEQEEAEYAFFSALAKRADTGDAKQIWREHAKEELANKQKLEDIMAAHKIPASEKIIADPDLKIAKYLVSKGRNKTDKLGYEDALILSIKRTRSTQNLYMDLKETDCHAEILDAFSFLARVKEDQCRKLEQEYDDMLRED
ncbi:MAG: hypothetical protein HQL54_01195 [Magnetococcales bacterium]|nr:hypothetical protein [Magnetococcales bacterium]